jgi:hypothetical protein
MAKHPVTNYIIGVDLGRDRDHSAFAVMALRAEDYGPFDRARHYQPTRTVLQLGALRRIPLGTEYLEVIAQLRRLVNLLHAKNVWGQPPARVDVVLDSAGPGQIAVELIRNERMNIHFVPALLTAGHEAGRSASGKRTVPRRELVSTLRYLLEVERLTVHDSLAHREAFEREVASVRPEGRQSAHDDLVIAAGLAAWHAVRLWPDLARLQRAA